MTQIIDEVIVEPVNLVITSSAPTDIVAMPTVHLVVVTAPAAILTVAEQGPRGPAGAAASVTSYPINNVASFTANHGLSYTPRVTVQMASGELVETDTYFAPGQVTLVFPGPFTGLLTLG